MPHQLTLVIITIVATALVALIVILRNPKSEITQSFAVLISCFVLWAAAQGVMYVSMDVRLAYTADVLAFFTALCIAWAFLRFAFLFPSRMFPVRKDVIATLGMASLLIISLILVPGFMIRDIQVWNPGFGFPVNTVQFLVYTTIFFSVFGYAYLILARKYFVSTAENKVLLLHVIYASLIPVTAGSILNLLLLAVNQLRYQIYGPSFTLFFTLTVAYLIFIRRER